MSKSKKDKQPDTELQIRRMKLAKQKISRWRKKTATSYAKELSLQPETIQIVPENTHRPIKATW